MLKKLSNIFKSQVQLYEFTKGTEKFYFTSGDRDFLFQNRTYKPVPIKCSSIKSTQDKSKASITVNVAKDNQVGDWFKLTTPGNVKLFVWRTSKDDVSQYERVFNGTVLGAEFQQSELVFTCEPLAALTSRTICRYTYQTVCNHNVYKGKCRLDVDDHSYFTKVIKIGTDGITLTIESRNGYAKGILTTGYIQSTGRHAAMIMQDDGSTTLKMLSPIENLKAGDTIRVVKGCDRSSKTCKEKFNNFDNFFGFEHVPTRNMFQTGVKSNKNNNEGATIKPGFHIEIGKGEDSGKGEKK